MALVLNNIILVNFTQKYYFGSESIKELDIE